MNTHPQTARWAFLGVLALLATSLKAEVGPLGGAPDSAAARMMQYECPDDELPFFECPPPLPPEPAPAAEPLDPPPPVVAIRVRVPAKVSAGDEIEYHICVENHSNASAHHVLVRDTVPANARYVRARPEPAAPAPELAWRLDTLEPGAVCEIVLVLAPAGTEPVENCARVQFEHGQCVCTRIAGQGRLALRKTGPERRYANHPATYQIAVTNVGSAALESVVVTDPIPANATFVHASMGGQLVGGQVQWTLGPMEAGETRTLDLVIKAREAGRICNRATARAERGPPAEAETCTDFVGVAALLLEVVDTQDPVEVGGETSYVIIVRNQGTLPATNLRIVALVPRELEVARITGPADHRLEGQRILFQPFELKPDTDARFVVYAKALAAGDVRFKVDLNADQLTSGPVHEEESTTLYADVPSVRLKNSRPGGVYAASKISAASK